MADEIERRDYGARNGRKSLDWKWIVATLIGVATALIALIPAWPQVSRWLHLSDTSVAIAVSYPTDRPVELEFSSRSSEDGVLLIVPTDLKFHVQNAAGRIIQLRTLVSAPALAGDTFEEFAIPSTVVEASSSADIVVAERLLVHLPVVSGAVIRCGEFSAPDPVSDVASNDDEDEVSDRLIFRGASGRDFMACLAENGLHPRVIEPVTHDALLAAQNAAPPPGLADCGNWPNAGEVDMGSWSVAGDALCDCVDMYTDGRVYIFNFDARDELETAPLWMRLNETVGLGRC